MVTNKEDISKITLDSNPIKNEIELESISNIENTNEILMPSLSATMSTTEQQIIRWAVKEGDKVKVGDLLAEIQTDKAIVSFESTKAGYISKILAKVGEFIKIGKVILVIDEKKGE
jgi:pyruvate/2-oxoglutarate dehydrogenase complex dihydrolipoamide acyltransferase (E2) component